MLTLALIIIVLRKGVLWTLKLVVMFSKVTSLNRLRLNNEFDSHWVPHIFVRVPYVIQAQKSNIIPFSLQDATIVPMSVLNTLCDAALRHEKLNRGTHTKRNKVEAVEVGFY